MKLENADAGYSISQLHNAALRRTARRVAAANGSIARTARGLADYAVSTLKHEGKILRGQPIAKLRASVAWFFRARIKVDRWS